MKLFCLLAMVMAGVVAGLQEEEAGCQMDEVGLLTVDWERTRARTPRLDRVEVVARYSAVLNTFLCTLLFTVGMMEGEKNVKMLT